VQPSKKKEKPLETERKIAPKGEERSKGEEGDWRGDLARL
jgi:hypothetical protein